MIKVVIVDDHRMFIDGMKSFLADDKNIKVIDTATSGEEVLKVLDSRTIGEADKKDGSQKVGVDILILDIRMPNGMDGEEVLDVVREKYPDLKVLVVSMSEAEHDIQRMLHSGANGYLLKDKGKEELVNAINTIQSGERYIPPKLALKAIPRPRKKTVKAELTPREMDVLFALSEGLTDKQIGDRLYIASTTVETHCRNMRKKTNTGNRLQLVNYARENGLLKDS